MCLFAADSGYLGRIRIPTHSPPHHPSVGLSDRVSSDEREAVCARGCEAVFGLSCIQLGCTAISFSDRVPT